MKWAQRENPYSPLTIELAEKRYVLFLFSFLFLHLLLAFLFPPAEDELYYLAWSKLPSLSYFDHPPMVAWWIRISTFFLGDSIWALRLPAILTHFVLFYQLGKLSQKQTILWFLLLTPISVFGAIIMTPDIPFLFFWFLYFQWAVGCDEKLSHWSSDPVSRVYRTEPISFRHWIMGGSLLGLGLLSKYTMALAPLCSLVIFLTKYRFRSWVRGFFIHLVIAGLLFSPVLIFNFRHQFAPFFFQWNHMQIPAQFTFLFTFLGNQILLLGALPFLLFPWLIIRYASFSGSSRFRVSFFFFIIPISFFLFKSTRHFLEANWALASYLSFWILASYFVKYYSVGWIKWLTLIVGFFVPITLTLAILAHLVHPISLIKAHQDRIGRMKAQMELTRSVKETLQTRSAFSIYLTNYQWTSYFRFGVSQDSHQVAETGRPSHFTLIASDPCQSSSVYFFHALGSPMPTALSCFKKIETIATYPLSFRGAQMDTFVLLELSQRSKL